MSDVRGGRVAAAAMPRGLAPPLVDEVVRPRLVDRLAERWNRTVVLVEAGGGYGKSIALAQAIRDNAADPTGVDLYHPCRPPDREAAHLAAQLFGALDSELPAHGRSPEELADLLAAQIAGRAPIEVCVTLDDLHHLAAEDDAVAMLAHLLRSLPINGHLVLSGRVLPKLPVTRLAAADRCARLGPDELAFDARETVALATQHDVDPRVLDASAGWPVMTRLAIVAGAGASIDYLFEEVVAGFDDDTRVGVAATALGRSVDDALLREVGTRVSVAQLLAHVPLVFDLGDGCIGTHDLWYDALDHLLDAHRLRTLAITVARWHRAAGRYDEALQVAAGQGAWPEAKAAIMAALGPDALLSSERTQRWLELFPADLQDEPELCLLRGTTARMTGKAGSGDADVERALELFRETGTPADLVAAAFEVGLCAWLRNDIPRVLEMYALAEELKAQGHLEMDPLIALVQHAIADLEGDPDRARRLLASIDLDAVAAPLAVLALQSRATLSFLLGESAVGVAAADELFDRAPNVGSAFIAAMSHWQHGDPELIRGRWSDLRNPVHDNTRYDFLGRVYSAVIDASVGIVADVSGLSDFPSGRSREEAFVALATAASLVAASCEYEAARRIEVLVDRVGLDDPLCRGELRRFLPYGYVLSPRVRAALDGDDLGPKLAELRGLAGIFLAARTGGNPDWRSLPSPPAVLCALPLAWSVELAAYAAAAGAPGHLELVEYLIDFTGVPVQDQLRQLTRRGGAAATGAAMLLAAVPGQPGTTTTIRACGRLAVAGADAELLRRTRVRELLELLVLRERVSAEQVIDALWPDLEAARGRNNLRITLSFVRKLLEPARNSREASFHIRRRDDEIRLHRSPYLDIDVWNMRDRIARGRALERQGLLGDAVEQYRAALDAWVDDAFVDLRDNSAAAVDVIGFDVELATAAARVAEWALAQGTTAEAIAAAERLLRHDPFSERAHGVLISALLADGNLAAADEAIERLQRTLTELGADPAPETAMVLRRFERRRAAAHAS